MRGALAADSHCVAVEATGQICGRSPGGALGFLITNENTDNRWLSENNESS
jgi:hypothetical protein